MAAGSDRNPLEVLILRGSKKRSDLEICKDILSVCGERPRKWNEIARVANVCSSKSLSNKLKVLLDAGLLCLEAEGFRRTKKGWEFVVLFEVLELRLEGKDTSKLLFSVFSRS